MLAIFACLSFFLFSFALACRLHWLVFVGILKYLAALFFLTPLLCLNVVLVVALIRHVALLVHCLVLFLITYFAFWWLFTKRPSLSLQGLAVHSFFFLNCSLFHAISVLWSKHACAAYGNGKYTKTHRALVVVLYWRMLECNRPFWIGVPYFFPCTPFVVCEKSRQPSQPSIRASRL